MYSNSFTQIPPISQMLANSMLGNFIPSSLNFQSQTQMNQSSFPQNVNSQTLYPQNSIYQNPNFQNETSQRLYPQNSSSMTQNPSLMAQNSNFQNGTSQGGRNENSYLQSLIAQNQNIILQNRIPHSSVPRITTEFHPIIIKTANSVSSKEAMTPQGRMFEYNASGDNLDIEKIRNRLLENGISNVFTENTPYSNFIKVQVTNPTPQQVRVIREALNISNDLTIMNNMFSILNPFSMLIGFPFQTFSIQPNFTNSMVTANQGKESSNSTVTIEEVTDE